jgi:hypothetical protein
VEWEWAAECMAGVMDAAAEAAGIKTKIK